MPGEFYIEGKAEKVDLIQVIEKITSETFGLEVLKDQLDQLGTRGDDIQAQTDKLAGETPVSGSATQNWHTQPGGNHDYRTALHAGEWGGAEGIRPDIRCHR